MYILACNVEHTSPCGVNHKNLSQREFRWELAKEIVMYCDEHSSKTQKKQEHKDIDIDAKEIRFAEGSADSHHWEKMVEYVHRDVKDQELLELSSNPVSNKKKKGDRDPRSRDKTRHDLKVRSKIHFTSQCVVFWGSGKNSSTDRYCRECAPRMDNWTYKTRGDGYMSKYHPRLCSSDCFVKYHTTRINGLDYNQRKARRMD